MNNIKNVLSIFNGIGVGQFVLDELGINYENYFSSEINKNCNKLTSEKFKNLKHLGDVKFVKGHELPKIDLLIGGSPCQGFSSAGKNLNFEDERSKLFFEYYRILKELRSLNPNILFFLENVPMRKESEDIISDFLGVESFELKAEFFVPQKRKRIFWTNIKFDKKIEKIDYKISDFIEGIGFATNAKLELNPRRIFFKKTNIFGTITASYYKGISGSSRPAVSVKEGYLDEDRESHRSLTVNEIEKIFGLPKNYTEGFSKTERMKMLGNSWEFNSIKFFFKNLCS